jgi:hypothetical protein
MFSMRSAVRWPILTKPVSMDLDGLGTVNRPPKSLDWPEGNLGEPKNRNFGRAPGEWLYRLSYVTVTLQVTDGNPPYVNDRLD